MPSRPLRIGVCTLLLAAVSGAVAGSAPLSLTQLRRDFTRRIDAEGYTLCPEPGIGRGDPASFGHYLPERNTVVIADWRDLSPDEQQAFEARAGNRGEPVTARSVFEQYRRWVFVHELGHWWQACRHQRRPGSSGEEAGADRIALAFWRKEDPRLAAAIVQDARAVLAQRPEPPPEARAASRPDASAADLSVASERWLQSRMIADLAEEAPPPSFHKSLSQPLYPW